MFAYGARTAGCLKIKFLHELFTKSSWCPEATPLVARRSVRNSLSFRRSLGELENLFAREKVLENRLRVECNLKNYPVDDF